MSILAYGPNQTRLTFEGGNDFLACLQTATNRRFADGRGYFLTMAGRGDDGQDICVSYWMHPSIPMMFVYDTEDETGEPPQTVDVTEDHLVCCGAFQRKSTGIFRFRLRRNCRRTTTPKARGGLSLSVQTSRWRRNPHARCNAPWLCRCELLAASLA